MPRYDETLVRAGRAQEQAAALPLRLQRTDPAFNETTRYEVFFGDTLLGTVSRRTSTAQRVHTRRDGVTWTGIPAGWLWHRAPGSWQQAARAERIWPAKYATRASCMIELAAQWLLDTDQVTDVTDGGSSSALADLVS